MEETNGYAIAINVLGEKIAALQKELRFAGYNADNLEAELNREKNINAMLQKQLDEVRAYIDRLEEK